MQTSVQAPHFARARLALAAALCVIAGCNGKAASTLAAGFGSSGTKDGGRGDDAGADGGSARGSDGGRDAGSAFGFEQLAIDAAVGGGVDGGVLEVPSGWSCRSALALDRVCDCGCGGPDGACSTPGCTTPGCALPVCEACFDADGEQRDCGAPGAWLCERARRADGVCDCGCGALDPDCQGGGCYQPGCDVEGCELCHDGSAVGDCPAPAVFRCSKAVKGDGLCDCGCGNYDPDCTHSACVDADCYASGCDVCHDRLGRSVDCQPPPAHFSCDPAVRGDGVCDCGCGEADPDCPSGGGCAEVGCTQEQCEVCHDAFGRVVPCPGLWTCGAASFGDGRRCDCGCGRADPDCGGEGCADAGCDAAACDVRHDESGRALAPGDWSCAPSAYGGGDGCDCGCGALDPDCAAGCSEPGCRAPSCDHCRLADGSTFNCRFSCDLARYGSGDGCDCGCGAPDPDCAGLGCYQPGCYADGCGQCFDSSGDAQTCERGACAAGYQNDGVCDCGCRQDDPDCISADAACVEPGCSTDGCGRCHDPSGARVTCQDWTCQLEKQGGGDGCNCGCGAPDPDCAPGQGCTQAGCFTSGCVTCRSADGAPMSCAP